MKTKAIIFFKLVWTASILTKFIYAYIAYDEYKTVPHLSSEFYPQLIICLLMGIIAVLIGIYFSISAIKIDSKISKIVTKIFIKSQIENNNNFFQVFTISLGLIETSALFGLVGFLLSYNLVFLIIMFGLSLAGWLFSYPKNQ